MSKDLLRKVAGLESKVDALESEISYIDIILRRSGFSNGLNTLKSTVEELLKEAEGKNSEDEDFDGLFA